MVAMEGFSDVSYEEKMNCRERAEILGRITFFRPIFERWDTETPRRNGYMLTATTVRLWKERGRGSGHTVRFAE